MTEEKDRKTDEVGEEPRQEPASAESGEAAVDEKAEVFTDPDQSSDQPADPPADREGDGLAEPGEDAEKGGVEGSEVPEDEGDPIIEELVIPGEEDTEEQEALSGSGDEEESLKEPEEAGEPANEEAEGPEDDSEDPLDLSEEPEEARIDAASREEAEDTLSSEQEVSEDEFLEADDETEQADLPGKSLFRSKRSLVYISGSLMLVVLIIGGFLFYGSGGKETQKTEIQSAKRVKNTGKTAKRRRSKPIVFTERTESFVLFYDKAKKPVLIKIKLTLEIPKGKEKSRSYRMFKDYLYDRAIRLKFYKERMSKWDLILLRELHKIFLKWPGKLPVRLKEVDDVEFL